MGYKTWIAAAVLGTAAVAAVAHPGPDGRHGGFGPMGPMPMGEMALFGPGLLGLDGGPGGPGFRGPRGERAARADSPEWIDARIDRMAERVVRSVDGTPEQAKRIGDIARKAAADLRALRGERTDSRAEAIELMKAPTVDRAAIETLRSQRIARADAISKRVTTAFADIAEVFTPEQRTKLVARWEQRTAAARDGQRPRGPHGERGAPAAPAPAPGN